MTYSPAGEVLSMTNTLTGASFNSGNIVTNVQNTVNGPSSYTFGNGLDGVRSYDGLGRANGEYVCANSTSAGCSGGTQTYGMTQTVVGSRVTAMNDSVLGTSATPSYDEFNRLTSMNYSTRGQAFTYTYDRYGNRWGQTVTKGSGPSPQLTFNANNQVTTVTYDAAGNYWKDGTNTYSYDAEGNLIGVTGGTTASYGYDALNHRVRESTPSLNVAYTFNTDGQRVAQWSESGSSPAVLATYSYWNGVPIATYTTSGAAYSHQDLLGTKRLTTTSTGAVAGSYQSLAFGDGYTTSGSDPDQAHFGLLDYDSETATDHAQFRQLSAAQGRWMSPDPYDGSYDFANPQSLNRFTYALNNPLFYVDPSGQDCVVNNGLPGPAGFQVNNGDCPGNDPNNEFYVDCDGCLSNATFDSRNGNFYYSYSTSDGTLGLGVIDGFGFTVPDGGGSDVAPSFAGLTSNFSFGPQGGSGPGVPNNINCNTKLPNGKTVGDYVRAARTQMNSITGTGSPPLDAYHMLTTFKGLVGGGSAIDFKNTMAGQAPLELLGNAGNFAYYAIGSGYFSAGILDMGAGGYAIKSAFIPSSPVKFSALTMPYGQDTSAKLQEGPGLAAQGCGVKTF